MNRKKLFLWSLYDFANSVVMIVFFLYYSQWLVVDRGVPDFWFNMTFVGSSLLFLLTVPVAAAVVDKIKTQMPGLRITTILAAVFYSLTGFIALQFPEYYIWSIITYSFATYFYLFSFTFYNPLLNEIAPPERHGIASGWGMFGDWAGQMAGLLVTLPLATGAIIFWGAPGRASTLIPATLLFFICALPMLIFFKENAVRVSLPINLKEEYKKVFGSLKKLCRLPGVGLFFLAYFFFNDAVTTAGNNFPIYTEKLFGVPDELKSYLLMGIIVTSAIGAPLSGYLADKFGFKKVLLYILAGWVVVMPLLALAKNFSLFVVICMFMGLFYGAIWTVTRAYLVRLTPPEMLNRSFTYYTLMERFATFIGPISWGLIVMYLPKAGAFNYRFAAAAMTVFVIIGLILARRLPEKIVME